MNFNYIDSKGNISAFFLNGVILKNFFNLELIYQFFIFYNCFYRINKNAQKSRSFINYSTKKIYKQKGTGRARAGSLSSCIRVKGSRSFPNLYYINYFYNFNKKKYKLSYFLIYSNLFFNNFFFILEDFFFIDIKSKLLFFYFKNIFYIDNFFILTIKVNKKFFLSLINFKKIKLFYFFNFNPIILLKYKKIIITRSCFEYFLNA
ncbi:50S ribosomal protein L4 [Candidatus Nasuia deltocephalinicola]|uniref:50S ribosomal protein L4 n=1 Tax=Candidatus Nasuia deltocephalincola TaxID=1160784 RepID=UPI00216AFCD5|nr:50S ribosomal protein L4 [Candidatus Nasuia deltocephalinicola]